MCHLKMAESYVSNLHDGRVRKKLKGNMALGNLLIVLYVLYNKCCIVHTYLYTPYYYCLNILCNSKVKYSKSS